MNSNQNKREERPLYSTCYEDTLDQRRASATLCDWRTTPEFVRKLGQCALIVNVTAQAARQEIG